MTLDSTPTKHPGNGFAPASRAPKAAPVPSLVKRVLDNAFAGGRHLRYHDGEFHRFVGTHWKTVSRAEIGGTAQSYLDAGTFGGRLMPVIRDLVDQLAVTTSGQLESPAALEATPVINVANGELWFAPDGSVVLRPHAPDSQQQHCLGYSYDSKAACPTYDRAIAQILGEQRATIWDEQAGYVLQQTRPRPHLAVAVGKGGDGKSFLTAVLTKLLGHGQVLATPVEDLTASRFSLGGLAGKHMFLDDDVSAGVRLPDGVLKKMSEGRPVSGERKGREGLTFTLRAVPFLVGNNVPRLDDRSPGFRRRLMVFEFRRTFADHEVEYGLLPRILADEMPGVLNRAIGGLQRLIRRGWRFNLPETMIADQESWWAAATGQSTSASPPRASVRQDAVDAASSLVESEEELDIGSADAAPRSGVAVAINAAGPCAVTVRAGTTTIDVNVSGA